MPCQKGDYLLLSIYSLVLVSLIRVASLSAPFDPICFLHLRFKLLADSVLFSLTYLSLRSCCRADVEVVPFV